MKLITLALVSFIALPSWAGFKEAFALKKARFEQSRNLQRLEDEDIIHEKSIKYYSLTQLVNPADPTDGRTFSQRYMMNSELAKDNNSPVFLFLCGEWTCDASDVATMAPYAKEFKGHLVAMEHRFYGRSQPFASLTSENLQYLKTDLALQDFSKIQMHIQKTMGLKGPWIVVGASYSASLAAYYRARYPNLVVGAWASSGPVQARYNFEQYDLHVAKVAGENCAQSIRQVVKEIETSLLDPKELKAMKKLFDAEVLENNVDFLYLIADMAALAVQYGYKDEFCDGLAQGQPLKAYSQFVKKIFESWDMTALSGSAAGATSLDAEDYLDHADRQWFYQSCTEYGYWQNSYHDASLTVRSALINSEYHRDICKRLYGIDGSDHTEDLNKSFYESILNPGTTNIYFTNGEEDPWSNLSITSSNGNAQNPGLTTFVIDGAAHCDDLGHEQPGDSLALKEARQIARAKFYEWLGY